MLRMGGYRIGGSTRLHAWPSVILTLHNYLEQNIKSCIKFFADDTMLDLSQLPILIMI